jgi:Leucine-rich repeat (LRR) protein
LVWLGAGLAQAQDRPPLDTSWTQWEAAAQQKPAAVKRLDMRGVQRVPAGISQYENLRALHLGDSEIRRLPREIAELTSLRAIYLPRTQRLDYQLAFQFLRRLPRLRHVDLSYNNLTTLPATLFDLAELRELNLSLNRLQALPPDIQKLRQLRKLDLTLNESLSTLPPALWQLPKLQELYLNQTALQSLDAGIGQLTTLRRLSLAGMPLTAVPANLSQLRQLRWLSLSYCQDLQWAATFRKLARLPRLQTLRLNRAKIDTSQAKVRRGPQPDTLQAAGASGLRHLVPWLGQQDQLQYLDISNTELGEALPRILPLDSLRYLDISALDLKTLPVELDDLQALETLVLQYNDLQLSELRHLRKLPNLERLRLSYGRYSNAEMIRLKKMLPDTQLEF